MGKVEPPPPYITAYAAIVGKLWLLRNVVLNIGEKTPLFMKKLASFGWGRFSCCVPVGPKMIQRERDYVLCVGLGPA